MNSDKVELPKDLATALYHQLLNPKKDENGNVIYPISITLALQIRMAIGDQVK